MKIEGNAPSQGIDLYRKVDAQKQAKVEDAARPQEGQEVTARLRDDESEKVSISYEARLRAVAQNAIDKLPDVRQQKVEALSKLIESGEYNPDAEQIAEKMLSEIGIKL